MGADGGTIQTRKELVKTAKKPERKDGTLDRNLKWHFCALSKEPLTPPVVADDLGRLYNKESVLRILLDRKAFGDSDAVAPHIESMKDVVVLDLTPNPAFNAATSTSDSPSPRFICPVSMREMNGRLRFIYLPCGHALSEQALKELGANVCGHCGKEFAEDDAIPINPKEEEIQRLKDRMAKRKAVRSAEEARKKAEKKAAKAAAKKDKETAALANGETSGKPSEEGLEEDGKDREKKRKQREEDEGPGLTYAPPRATDNIRMKLPDLGTLGDKIKGRIDKQSDAVKAIYSKKIEPEKALSPFFQGTFVR